MGFKSSFNTVQKVFKKMNCVEMIRFERVCLIFYSLRVQGDNKFKPRSNSVQKINNGEKSLPIFKNNSEKYEYLIKHNPSDTWIAEFKQTKEYKLLYE